MTIFRLLHNGTFQKTVCLQKSIVKVKAEDKKVCSTVLFKIILTIRYTFLATFYQRAGANSPPRNFNNNLNFRSFAHDFNIFAYFVMKNWMKSNGKLSNCLKSMQSQRYAIYLSFKPAKASSQTF